jgi:hypothetical protein
VWAPSDSGRPVGALQGRLEAAAPPRPGLCWPPWPTDPRPTLQPDLLASLGRDLAARPSNSDAWAAHHRLVPRPGPLLPPPQEPGPLEIWTADRAAKAVLDPER